MSGGGDHQKPISSQAIKLPMGAITRDTELLEKMTRWDRITKQHLHKVDVQTSQVKRLFGLNFVNERQQRNMNGDYGADGDALRFGCNGNSIGDDNAKRFQRGSNGFLDPALVMEMRHLSVSIYPSDLTTRVISSVLIITRIPLDTLKQIACRCCNIQ